VWIDDERNEGNMNVTIAEAIRDSRFFIAVLTKSYNSKIEGGTKHQEWCFYELNYATYVIPPSSLVLVSFESEMNDQSKWCTYLQFVFANYLSYDLSQADKSTVWEKFITDVMKNKALLMEEEFKTLVLSNNSTSRDRSEKNANPKIDTAVGLISVSVPVFCSRL
jgi:hypothetical protein